MTLHEENLSQKAGIIVEHFRRHVAHKVAGRAKAMVVTSSRKHAVRMARALRKHADTHGYGSLGILVAFSGSVEDEGISHTEAQMNGFSEGRTPDEFEEDTRRFLVVADKYQTGFDQPLLYAMYVDKTLTGLAAVQTLSRLNRRAEGKDGTFVLDFRNDADDIRAEFEKYYGKTISPPTDPNLLYDTRRRLDEFGVLRNEEIGKVAALLADGRSNHARLHAALAPAVDRFHALDEEEKDAFRDALTRFVRTYSFLSQVVSFTDVSLERDYRFCRALASFVGRGGGASLDLGSEVELTHLQLERTFEGSVSLEAEKGVVTAIYDGMGRVHEPEASPLSRIVSDLNEKFGLKLTEADRLHLDSVAQNLVEDERIQRQAAANSEANFGVRFPNHFQNAMVDRLSGATDLTHELLRNDEMADEVRSVYMHAARLWPGEGRVAGTLPHRRPPRPAPERRHAPRIQIHIPDAGGGRKQGRTLQAAPNREHKNHRRVPEQPRGRNPSHRDFRRRLGLRPRRRLRDFAKRRQGRPRPLSPPSRADHHKRRRHGRRERRTGNSGSRGRRPLPRPRKAVEVDKNGRHTKKTILYGRFGNGTRVVGDTVERERYRVQVWG